MHISYIIYYYILLYICDRAQTACVCVCVCQSTEVLALALRCFTCFTLLVYLLYYSRNGSWQSTDVRALALYNTYMNR